MKHKLCTAAVCIGMLLALALPAWAAEYGEANITPQTTMNELRENPSIVGSGLYTYSREQDCTLKQAYWGTQELEKFSNQWTAQDAAEEPTVVLTAGFAVYGRGNCAGHQPGRCGTILFSGAGRNEKPEICTGAGWKCPDYQRRDPRGHIYGVADEPDGLYYVCAALPYRDTGRRQRTYGRCGAGSAVYHRTCRAV